MAVLLTKSFPFFQTIPLTARKEGTGWWYSLTGGATTDVMDCKTINGQTDAYLRCPAVNSILNKKARAYSNGIWKIVDIEGNEPKNMKDLPLYKLMRNPNVLQTWNEFETQFKLFQWIYGQCFIYCLYPEGMGVDYTESLWVIPNWMIEPVTTGKFYQQTKLDEIIVRYDFLIGGGRIPIPRESILTMRDISVNLWKDPKNINQGQSRLYPMSDVVNNVTASYEARNVLIQRRGAIGILSNESKDTAGLIKLTPKEREEIQNDFQTFGIARNKHLVNITNANLKWQQIAMNVKDLMLFEEVADGTRQIADAYDYPTFLLGFKEGTTYDNVNSAKKSLYTDALIPESKSDANQFSQCFKLYDRNLMIIVSYDHLDIFQQSQKEKSDALNTMIDAQAKLYNSGFITKNQMLTELNLPVVADGDVYVTDADKTPMAVKFGVGGTQAMQSFLTDTTLLSDQKLQIMIILFSINEQDARKIIYGK